MNSNQRLWEVGVPRGVLFYRPHPLMCFPTQDWEGETRFAEYSHFRLSNELNSYKLFLANYSGNAGDSLRYHNNTNFSTKNKDNDKCVDDCAALRKGMNTEKLEAISKNNLQAACQEVGQLMTNDECDPVTPPNRWLLVQLLHRLQPEWRVLPQRAAHQEHRWHDLVWLAWAQLLHEEGGDEDQTTEFSPLSGPTAKAPGCRWLACRPRDQTNTCTLRTWGGGFWMGETKGKNPIF